MEHQPLIESGLLVFFLIGIMEAWDGLIRRHIRLTLDALRLDFHVRGIAAICLGALSLLVAILVARAGVSQMESLGVGCQPSLECVVRTLVVPPFTTWGTAFLTGCALLVFLIWASGAGDLNGPYWRYPVAPGVVFNEKDIVTRVERRLQEANLPPLDSDTIVRMVHLVRYDTGQLSIFRRGAIIRDGHVQPSLLTNKLVSMHAHDVLHIPDRERRILIETIVQYYQELHARGTRVYPWNRQREQR